MFAKTQKLKPKGTPWVKSNVTGAPDDYRLNRPGFDAASFLAKDACHAEEVPD